MTKMSSGTKTNVDEPCEFGCDLRKSHPEGVNLEGEGRDRESKLERAKYLSIYLIIYS